MKSMIVALAVVLSSGSAFAAQGSFISSFNDQFEILYLSWCDGKKVVAVNEEGKYYTRFNCEDQGQVCRVYDAYKMGRVLYSANCEKAK